MSLDMLFNVTQSYLENAYEQFRDVVEVYYHGYIEWLLYILYPIVLTCLMPVVIFIFFYGSSIFLHLYKIRHLIWDAWNNNIWECGQKMVCAFWEACGQLWHGHEVIGLENIPLEGPALIIYYHGAIPIDLYYLIAKAKFYRNRLIMSIGDRFMFKIPGLQMLMETFNVIPGSMSQCMELMKQGHILSIAPGGLREALFGDSNYLLMWGKRTGFAKIAIETHVPIIPMFTQNHREAFRTVNFRILRWIYEKTRLPVVPIYGGFPVKMRTFLGDPIYHEPGITQEMLALKVQSAIEDLIEKHQKRPGNIFRALSERFYTSKKYKLS